MEREGDKQTPDIFCNSWSPKETSKLKPKMPYPSQRAMTRITLIPFPLECRLTLLKLAGSKHTLQNPPPKVIFVEVKGGYWGPRHSTPRRLQLAVKEKPTSQVFQESNFGLEKVFSISSKAKSIHTLCLHPCKDPRTGQPFTQISFHTTLHSASVGDWKTMNKSISKSEPGTDELHAPSPGCSLTSIR